MTASFVDAGCPVLECVTRVAPFGVRFVDFVTGQVVSGLEVTMARAGDSEPPLELASNPSGVFYLVAAPGLRDFTLGRGDEEFWAHAPAPSARRLYVRDPQNRYLAFAVEVSIPQRGLWAWPSGFPLSPLQAGVPGIPLFSNASRIAPAGMAVVRSQLFDALLKRPAAWAVLDLLYSGQLWGRGIADERGASAVIMPYPPPIDYLPDSPLLTGASLWEQEWQFDVRIHYAPASKPAPALDLDSALGQLDQPPATAWEDLAQTTPLAVATLRYGSGLTLRSSSAGSPVPELLVTPALSPP
jgi:hypothetical protein